MPPLLGVMSLVPKPGHCTVSTDCYLTTIICMSSSPMQCFSLLPSNLYRYVQHLSFAYILSDSLFNARTPRDVVSCPDPTPHMCLSVGVPASVLTVKYFVSR